MKNNFYLLLIVIVYSLCLVSCEDNEFVLTESGFENGYSYVDLGLPSGLKWATCNIGATCPEDYGLYFAWGEVESNIREISGGSFNLFNEGNYKWYLSHEYVEGAYSVDEIIKYNTIDNKKVLDPEDDAAVVNMGGTWHMPSVDDWLELFSVCEHELKIMNSVKGVIFKGPNGNSIFFPSAGTIGWECNYLGLYWLNSLNDTNRANTLGFQEYYREHVQTFFNDQNLRTRSRELGLPIRAVCE